MQNIPVAEGTGTCGTAALTKCMVITEDIQKDPRWDGYHAPAIPTSEARRNLIQSAALVERVLADLARRHCDILQGYLFAQPVPVAELKKLPDLLPVNSAI